jgi:hypothetical protein
LCQAVPVRRALRRATPSHRRGCSTTPIGRSRTPPAVRDRSTCRNR